MLIKQILFPDFLTSKIKTILYFSLANYYSHFKKKSVNNRTIQKIIFHILKYAGKIVIINS